MKIKICGLAQPQNIAEVIKAQADWVGFIFYSPSPRWIEKTSPDLIFFQQMKEVKKVGVFVNASFDEVRQKVKNYTLDYVQLHGDESVEYCQTLYQENFKLIKVFRIQDTFISPTIIQEYEPFVDFFLFDTQTKQYGGSGHVFDWQLLTDYRSAKPMIVGGGLNPDNLEKLLTFIREKKLPIAVIDLNSGVEIEPAFKDIEKVKKSVKMIRLYS